MNPLIKTTAIAVASIGWAALVACGPRPLSEADGAGQARRVSASNSAPANRLAGSPVFGSLTQADPEKRGILDGPANPLPLGRPSTDPSSESSPPSPTGTPSLAPGSTGDAATNGEGPAPSASGADSARDVRKKGAENQRRGWQGSQHP